MATRTDNDPPLAPMLPYPPSVPALQHPEETTTIREEVATTGAAPAAAAVDERTTHHHHHHPAASNASNASHGDNASADAPSVPGGSSPRSRDKKRKRHAEPYVEPSEPLPRGIPYDPADHPALASFDPLSEDHADLVRAFREPLFSKDPSATLAIAYSHRDAAAEERRRIRRRKRATLEELRDLEEDFREKKGELLALNSRLKASSRRVGGWTRKVFDLELEERPSNWNDKLAKLREYAREHGRVPEHIKKTKGTEEERSLAAFVSGVRSKVKRGHKSVARHPHRLEALERLGVHWESENDARFEAMFAKLLEYRREHGSFRMPSLDLCKESGDEELIALHNWVFSQVGSFRYQLKSKKVEAVRRFLDVGFSFERWYGTNGHVFDREIPPFNAICRRYVENNGVMDEKDVEILRKAAEKSPRRGKGKKQKQREKEKAERGKKKQNYSLTDSEKEAIVAPAAAGAVEGAAINGTAAGTLEGAVADDAPAVAKEAIDTKEKSADGNPALANASTVAAAGGATINDTSAATGGIEDAGTGSTPVVAARDTKEEDLGDKENAGGQSTADEEEENATLAKIKQEEDKDPPAPMEGVETVPAAIGDVATKSDDATADAAVTAPRAGSAAPAEQTRQAEALAPTADALVEEAARENAATKMEETAIDEVVNIVVAKAVAAQGREDSTMAEA